MTFEQFKKSSGAGPRISLRKSGSIGFNSPAVREYFSDHEFVNLYYDPENRSVGFEALQEKEPDAYTLQKREGDSEGGSVHAKAFMREYDLIPDSTKQYKAHWSEEHELVYINLENPILTYDN